MPAIVLWLLESVLLESSEGEIALLGHLFSISILMAHHNYDFTVRGESLFDIFIATFKVVDTAI